MKLNIQETWRMPSVAAARRFLRAWCSGVVREAKPRKGEVESGLGPMLRVALTVREKLRGILNCFRRRLTSGVIAGFNSYVQAARARARGYRNPETFKTMIYLITGRLQFSLPSLIHSG